MSRLKTIENIMIVSHLDDETIFGACELFHLDNWYVISVTGSSDPNKDPFKKVMELFGISKYKIYNGHDLINLNNEGSFMGKDTLKEISDNIKRDLDGIEYSRVVTHGPLGEYGHPDHQATYRMVRDMVDTSKLYVFADPNFGYKPNTDEEVNDIRQEAVRLYAEAAGGSAEWLNEIARTFNCGRAIDIKDYESTDKWQEEKDNV